MGLAKFGLAGIGIAALVRFVLAGDGFARICEMLVFSWRGPGGPP
jgi:hypothetical protein